MQPSREKYTPPIRRQIQEQPYIPPHLRGSLLDIPQQEDEKEEFEDLFGAAPARQGWWQGEVAAAQARRKGTPAQIGRRKKLPRRPAPPRGGAESESGRTGTFEGSRSRMASERGQEIEDFGLSHQAFWGGRRVTELRGRRSRIPAAMAKQALRPYSGRRERFQESRWRARNAARVIPTHDYTADHLARLRFFMGWGKKEKQNLVTII